MWTKIKNWFKNLWAKFRRKEKIEKPNEFSKTGRSLKDLFSSFKPKTSTKAEHTRVSKHTKPHHNVSTPKYRIKMAVESNRINRNRIKKWKY